MAKNSSEDRPQSFQKNGPDSLPEVKEEDYVPLGDRASVGNAYIEVFGRQVLEAGGFKDRCTDQLPLAPVGGSSIQANPVLTALDINFIYRLVYPTPYLVRLYYRVLEVIAIGYIERNPLSFSSAGHINHFLSTNAPDVIRKLVESVPPSTTAPSLMVTGGSGMGKSYAIGCILSQLPLVVRHTCYRGQRLNHVQVFRLYVQCPPQGTLKGLLFNILFELDLILGTTFWDFWRKQAVSLDSLLVQVALILFNYGIGVLVLDELQHLRARGWAETEQMLNFFVSLMNFLKVPLITVGTYAALDLLSGALRDGRRLCISGSLDFARYDADDAVTRAMQNYYMSFLTGLGQRPLTDEFNEKVFEIYQGFHFLLPNIVHRCNVEASFRGLTYVDDNVLRHYRDVELKPINGAMEAVRSNDPERIQLIDDLLSPTAIKALFATQKRRGAENRDSNAGTARSGRLGKSSKPSGSGRDIAEFPHQAITSEEIAQQCNITKQLFGKADAYPRLKEHNLLASRIAYGDLSPAVQESKGNA